MKYMLLLPFILINFAACKKESDLRHGLITDAVIDYRNTLTEDSYRFRDSIPSPLYFNACIEIYDNGDTLLSLCGSSYYEELHQTPAPIPPGEVRFQILDSLNLLCPICTLKVIDDYVTLYIQKNIFSEEYIDIWKGNLESISKFTVQKESQIVCSPFSCQYKRNKDGKITRVSFIRLD